MYILHIFYNMTFMFKCTTDKKSSKFTPSKRSARIIKLMKNKQYYYDLLRLHECVFIRFRQKIIIKNKVSIALYLT